MKKQKYTPEEIMKAHQYLYYVLNQPKISDYEYDMFCKEHGLFGGGGSDNPKDYTKKIIKLAKTFL